MNKGKCIKKGKNKAGKIYALISFNDGTYAVYTLSVNYDGRVRGGLSKRWCYVERNMSEDDAVALYEKRLNGKRKN